MLDDPGRFRHDARDPARWVARVFVLLVLLLVLASWFATQQVAAAFEYTPELGRPSFGEWAASPIGYVVDEERPGVLAHVYGPFDWARWEWRWSWHPWWCGRIRLLRCAPSRMARAQRQRMDGIFGRAHRAIAFDAALEFGVYGLVVFGRRRFLSARGDEDEGPTVYGSARWGRRREVLATGLVVGYRTAMQKAARFARRVVGKKQPRAKIGVVLGKWSDPKTGVSYQLRTDNAQPRGVLVLGPPGSGKSASNFIPTLLQYPESAIVYDPSFELLFTTSGAREQKLRNDVFVFAPTLPEDNDFGIVSAQLNPLDAIRWGTVHEVGDLQDFVSFLLDPADKAAQGAEAHWIVCGKSLGESVFAFLRYFDPERCTLRGAYEFLSDPSIGDDVDAAFQKMISIPLDPEGKYGWRDASGAATPYHPHVLYSAASTKRKPPNEKGSIVSTFLRFLEPYRDPMLDRLTSRSTIVFDDLMHGRCPQTWYFCIPERAVQRLRAWVAVVMGMAVRAQTGEGALTYVNNEPVARAKYRLLLAIDEARQLGPQEQLFMLFSAIRKYRVFFMLGFQDHGQILEVAGKNEQITSTCYYKVFYAPNKLETAEWVSKQLGQGTAINRTLSYRGSRVFVKRESSTSEGMHARSLANPDELMNMAADFAVLRVTNHRPMLARRFYYKESKELGRRALMPIPTRRPEVTRDRVIAPLVPFQVSPGGEAVSVERLMRAASEAADVEFTTTDGLPQRRPAPPGDPAVLARAAAALAAAVGVDAGAIVPAPGQPVDLGRVAADLGRLAAGVAAMAAVHGAIGAPAVPAPSPSSPAASGGEEAPPDAGTTATAGALATKGSPEAAEPGEAATTATAAPVVAAVAVNGQSAVADAVGHAVSEVRPAEPGVASTSPLAPEQLEDFLALGGAPSAAPAATAVATADAAAGDDDEYADDDTY